MANNIEEFIITTFLTYGDFPLIYSKDFDLSIERIDSDGLPIEELPVGQIAEVEGDFPIRSLFRQVPIRDVRNTFEAIPYLKVLMAGTDAAVSNPLPSVISTFYRSVADWVNRYSNLYTGALQNFCIVGFRFWLNFQSGFEVAPLSFKVRFRSRPFDRSEYIHELKFKTKCIPGLFLSIFNQLNVEDGCTYIAPTGVSGFFKIFDNASFLLSLRISGNLVFRRDNVSFLLFKKLSDNLVFRSECSLFDFETNITSALRIDSRVQESLNLILESLYLVFSKLVVSAIYRLSFVDKFLKFVDFVDGGFENEKFSVLISEVGDRFSFSLGYGIGSIVKNSYSVLNNKIYSFSNKVSTAGVVIADFGECGVSNLKSIDKIFGSEPVVGCYIEADGHIYKYDNFKGYIIPAKGLKFRSAKVCLYGIQEAENFIVRLVTHRRR